MVRRHALTLCLPFLAGLSVDRSLAAAQLGTTEIAKKAIPAVVFIKGLTTDGKEGTGSGFVVDPRVLSSRIST